MQRIEVDIVADRSRLEDLRSDWQRCFEQSDAPPYLCFDWFSLYQTHFGESGGLRVAVARVADQVAAILPLEKVEVTVGPIKERVLQFSGDGFAPWTSGVFARGFSAADLTSACLSRIRQTDSDWAFMRLSKVPTNAAFATQLHRSQMPGCIRIALPSTWQAYLQALPSSRRYGIKRRTKRLEGEHGVELLRVGLDAGSDSVELQRAIDAALRVSASSWQSRAEDGMAISDDNCRAFFVEVSAKMAAMGALDLSVLFLDGTPVSFLWGATRGPVTSISKLGFDAAHGSLSPGRAHIAMHIEDSIARGFEAIDFGHEFADQKRQWSESEVPLCELWYFPPGIKSALYRNWYRVRRGVK